MELRALLLLPLCFPGFQAETPQDEKRQSEGSTLWVYCPYTEQADQLKKMWCRMRGDKCEVLVETKSPTQLRSQRGTVTIEENRTYRVLYISMTNLQVEDSGTYSCAYRSKSNNIFHLKMISLRVFRPLQYRAPDAEERRPEGGTLQIQCPYSSYSAQQKKVWCRVKDDECELLGEMLDPTQHPYRTRTTNRKATMEDNLKDIINITMADLHVEDSGTYSCAYRYNFNYFPVKTISLIVFRELNKSELDRLSVQCPYGELKYSTQTKTWCRKKHRTACKPVVRTDAPSTWRNSKDLEARSSIQDDTQNRTITITVEKLQAQDTGIYWCALYEYRGPTHIMEISLSVSKKTQQYTVKEMGDVSVQCRYSTSDYGAVSKAWCKEGNKKTCTVLATTKQEPSRHHRANQQGRVKIQDDIQQGIVTILMQELQAQDSGVYWCALDEEGQLFRMEEVALNITEALPGTIGTTPTFPPGSTPASSSNVNTFILISGVLSILFILALISMITLCVRRRKQLKRKGNRQEDTHGKPEDIAQLNSSERMESLKDDSKDLKYATLNFKSQPSPEDPLYCNVEPSQVHRKPKEEYVEYAVIALKQLPTNDKG